MKDTKTKHVDSHFVSHDKSLDSTHVALETSHPDPTEVSQDGNGILKGHSQQSDVEPEEIGGQAERTTKSTRATLGRHITSDDGSKVSERRHKHVATNRKEKDKLFKK
jgi:hypothetical protein